jgi:hypothetical protein
MDDSSRDKAATPPQPKSRDRERPEQDQPVLSRDSELLERDRDEKAD